MNTEQKLEYINVFVSMASEAETYESALSHTIYTKGMVGAWFLDTTIPYGDYNRIWNELETIMNNKRKLP